MNLFCRIGNRRALHCGKQIPDDSIFCAYCGQKLDGSANPAVEAPVEEKKVEKENRLTPEQRKVLKDRQAILLKTKKELVAQLHLKEDEANRLKTLIECGIGTGKDQADRDRVENDKIQLQNKIGTLNVELDKISTQL